MAAAGFALILVTRPTPVIRPRRRRERRLLDQARLTTPPEALSMRALVVTPGQPNSGPLVEVPEPSPDSGSLLVHTLAMGICGTDDEIMAGRYGSCPHGRQELNDRRIRRVRMSNRLEDYAF